VYILMYGLALARVVLYLYESSQHFVRPMDDFQFYIACCVLPLWFARAAILTARRVWVTPGTQRMRWP
jgi:hypothetical protein